MLSPETDALAPMNAGALKILVQPASQADCKGNKVVFTVVAEGGTSTLHYQWMRKRVSDAAFTVFGARDSSKLEVPNIGTGTEAPDGTLYLVNVTSLNEMATSASATLTVNQITGIAPSGIATFTVRQGSNLALTVMTSGKVPLSYQWIKKMGPYNWQDLSDQPTFSGSQRELLKFSKLALSDSGIYKIRVTFPTINGNLCIETSSITRKINVTPTIDTVPPSFINLKDSDLILCPQDPAGAIWNDSLAMVQLQERASYCLPEFSSQMDIPPSRFDDNVTPSVNLVQHWGIYSMLPPFEPVRDQSGTLLDNRAGPISLHTEPICLEVPGGGSPSLQIIFWLEDQAGNLTPETLRHKIRVSIAERPKIISGY